MRIERKHAYYATLEPCDDGSFCVYFNDFAGCASAGKSEADAVENAKIPLSLHLLAEYEARRPLPRPSAPESIPLEPGEKTALVEVDLRDFFPEIFPTDAEEGPDVETLSAEDFDRCGRPRSLTLPLTEDEAEILDALAKRAKLLPTECLRSLFLERYFETYIDESDER